MRADVTGVRVRVLWRVVRMAVALWREKARTLPLDATLQNIDIPWLAAVQCVRWHFNVLR